MEKVSTVFSFCIAPCEATTPNLRRAITRAKLRWLLGLGRRERVTNRPRQGGNATLNCLSVLQHCEYTRIPMPRLRPAVGRFAARPLNSILADWARGGLAANTQPLTIRQVGFILVLQQVFFFINSLKVRFLFQGVVSENG
jgi:hypothetical protein